MSTETKEKCFIITPIGDDSDPIRRHIEGIIDAAITPALSEKYEIVVAHKISEPGSITKQIISEIYNAKLVIANITNRNPNVMYELALRHAIGKPVITIAEKGTPLPADIVSQRTIFYYNDAKGVLELRNDLIKAETEVDFTNKSGPIIDVLGEISHDAIVLQNIKKNDSEDVEPLKYILDKLNRIENTIIPSRKQRESYYSGDNFVRKMTVLLRYDNYDVNPQKTILRERLSNVPNILFDDIDIDYNNKTILISFLATDFIDIKEIHTSFLNILSEYGFKKLWIDITKSIIPHK